MSKLGTSIRYILVDLIEIYLNNSEEFILKRDDYLRGIKEPLDSYFYKIDNFKMKKIIEFINENIDSLTCENEMKMECFFNDDEPAFIDDKVNTRLFNFSYADKIYSFAMLKSAM